MISDLYVIENFLDIIGNGLDSIMRVFLTIMALVFVSLFFHTVRNLYFFLQYLLFSKSVVI